MKPGEVLLAADPITLNAGRPVVELEVINTSDHTIFVSSHFPFFEANRRLMFDRVRAWGMRLDLPAGDTARWAPDEIRTVRLVPFAGRQVIRGFNGIVEGSVDPTRVVGALRRAMERGHEFVSAAPPVTTARASRTIAEDDEDDDEVDDGC